MLPGGSGGRPGRCGKHTLPPQGQDWQPHELQEPQPPQLLHALQPQALLLQPQALLPQPQALLLQPQVLLLQPPQPEQPHWQEPVWQPQDVLWLQDVLHGEFNIFIPPPSDWRRV